MFGEGGGQRVSSQRSLPSLGGSAPRSLYASARSREARLTQRSQRSSQRSASGLSWTARSGAEWGAASMSQTQARNRLTQNGRFPERQPTWMTRKDWIAEPHARTLGELKEKRRRAIRPDPTFDVDGDGTISQADLFLASRFDTNKDGVLQGGEQHALRKQMVKSLVKKFRDLNATAMRPEAADLIRRFTKDIDRTVESKDFNEQLNALHRATMVGGNADSSQMHKVLAPAQAKAMKRTMNVGHGGSQAGNSSRGSVYREAADEMEELDTYRTDRFKPEHGPHRLKPGMRDSGLRSYAALQMERRKQDRLYCTQGLARGVERGPKHMHLKYHPKLLFFNKPMY